MPDRGMTTIALVGILLVAGCAATPSADDGVVPGDNIDISNVETVPPSDFVGCLRADAVGRQYVTLGFDINEQGRARNIQVLDSSDRCFNRSALRALQKWQFPETDASGQPFPRTGAVTTITFDVFQG